MGFTVDHAHWGIVDTYSSPLYSASQYVPQYTEGGDAGSLTIKASAQIIDGTIDAQSYPGVRQLADSVVGTATSSIYGDQRAMQGASSQLPAGGFLLIQAQDDNLGGANIVVESAADYQALPGTLGYGQTMQVGANSVVTVSARDPNSYLSASQLGTINLSDGLLSDSGFGQVSLTTSGTVTVASNASVTLNPGGIFNVLAGHKITVDGTVSAPGGQISLVTSSNLGAAGLRLCADPERWRLRRRHQRRSFGPRPMGQQFRRAARRHRRHRMAQRRLDHALCRAARVRGCIRHPVKREPARSDAADLDRSVGQHLRQHRVADRRVRRRQRRSDRQS